MAISFCFLFYALTYGIRPGNCIFGGIFLIYYWFTTCY